MKKIAYLLTGLALTLCLASCGGASEDPTTGGDSTPSTTPSGGGTTVTPGIEVEVYLILGEGGLYKGQAGSDDLIDDFNVVKYKGRVGDNLPGSTDVTNTDSNKTFNGWLLNGANVTEVMGANGHYTAIWKEGGSTSTTSEDTPTGEGYAVSIAGTSYKLDVVDMPEGDQLRPTLRGEASLNFTAKENDAVVFYKDGTAITSNIGGEADDVTNDIANNLRGEVGSFYIAKAGSVTMYFHTWESGGYSAWVTGGPKVSELGPVNPGTEFEGGEVTITGIPDWIGNDGCKVFVWAWGGAEASGGKWYTAALTNDTLVVTLPAGATGFNMARCQKDTVTPDWNQKEDSAGRVYNKTGDVTLQAGVFTYTSPAWSGYSPS